MSDRHEKWVPVEPGHVIPAGQPYAIRYAHGTPYWAEYLPKTDITVWSSGQIEEWLVDSSWRPPLDLPTEPTWGIAVWKERGNALRRWYTDDEGNLRSTSGALVYPQHVADFIPLTDEQVARIEAAR